MNIKKLLIANRGEIACRIIKTAHRMGITTIAVYSTADAQALHVSLADEAYCIGEAPAEKSYLNAKAIIRIAKKAHANAIHPGYGFLSENSEFAALCQEARILFIGPSIRALEIMGNKSLAKSYMEKAHVPITPGYFGAEQDINKITQIAQAMEFPILVKAAAGGGGKGMRLVHQPADCREAIQSAKREAKASFADDTLLIEQYIERARHVELQIFMDTQGNGVHLFDRDCSIQRRHQKIIEEAPAPGLKKSTREKMAQTALAAAKAIQYVGAGTIEFLVDAKQQFYFMEMNTRLQVEHPVTEMITGLDLVEWQILVAQGEPLPCKQSDIKAHGHAFEARIYAENPYANFSPSAGPLHYFSLPEPSKQIRVDTGVQVNDTISVYYDPMIAKLITWGSTREAALSTLEAALAKSYIAGIDTNIALLHDICTTKDFRHAHTHTDFIEQHADKLITKKATISDFWLIAACVAKLKQERQQGKQFSEQSADAYSPWFSRDGWRLHDDSRTTIALWHAQKAYHFIAKLDVDQMMIQWQKHHYHVESEWLDEHQLTITIIKKQTKQSYNFFIVNIHGSLHLFHHGAHEHFLMHGLEDDHHLAKGAGNLVTSVMPGTIAKILVTPEQHVRKGEQLLVLEAMKMEHTITAPQDGIIGTIHYKAGDTISESVELLELKPAKA